MAHDPLILFLKDRSKRRFAELVAARREMVLNTAWRVTGDVHAAEDVAQDVLLKLLDLEAGSDGVRSPTGLLVTMTVNAARSRLRGEDRRRGREREAVRRKEEAGSMDGDKLAQVRKAVSELPEKLRESVELRYFGGLPLAAVAKATGLALRTVNLRLRQARDLMRPQLTGVVPPGALAFLAGDQEAGLPTLQPSRRFLERTDRLAAESRLPASRHRGPGVGVAGTVGLCALLLVAAFLIFGEHGGDGNEPSPDVIAEALARGTGSYLPEIPFREKLGGRTDGAPEAVGPAAVAGDPPGRDGDAIGFSIRVTDEKGNLLEEGELRIRLSVTTDFDKMVALKKWRGLLDPQPLADANPFEVTGLPPAADGIELEVSARVPGRPPTARTELTIREGETASVTVVVPRAREISLEVRNRVTGEAVEGAAVVSLTELRRRKIEAEGALGKDGPGSAVTGHDGRCRLGGLGTGTHTVEVYARGYTVVELYNREPGEEVRVDLVPIRDPATVIVEVVGPEGRALEGVRVRMSAGGGNVGLVLRTDARGTCRFESVGPGGHWARVEYQDWLRRAKAEGWKDDFDRRVVGGRFDVKAGEEFRLRLGHLPETGTFTVVVRDPGGKPCPGVEVYLSGPDGGYEKTDASGKAVFDARPVGEYRVTVGDWSYEEHFPLGAGEDKVVPFVAGRASIRGKALPGASVYVEGRASDLVKAGEDGTFEVKNVPPGSWKVRAWTDQELSAPVTVEVKGAASPPPVDLKLIPAGRILVTFRMPDRAALADAKIRLLDPKGEEQILAKDRTGEWDRKTQLMLPGRYEIEVTLPDAEPRRTTVVIEGGSDVKVELGVL